MANALRCFYMIMGGYSYAAPGVPASGEPDSECYTTFEEAWREWTRRRNDWSGRYPMWGDGCLDDQPAIVYGNEVETIDAWTVREVCEQVESDDYLGEVGDYYDWAE